MVVNSSTARADILKEFYNLIKTNINGVTVTVAYVDDLGSIPQIVVNTPKLPKNIDTFDLYNRSGSIDIEIYSSSIKSLTNIIDEVEDLLFTNKNSLGVQSLTVGDGSIASVDLTQKRIHTVTLPFSFRFKR